MTPSVTSFKNLAHFGQGLHENTFSYFNYGEGIISSNRKYYGQANPPLWYLSDITCPVALFMGTNDEMTPPEDLARLKSELPASVVAHEQMMQGFNHVDFVWAHDVGTLLNEDLVKLIDDFT